MPLFSFSDSAIHSSDSRKTFLIGHISKVRVISSPFFIFTGSRSF